MNHDDLLHAAVLNNVHWCGLVNAGAFDEEPTSGLWTTAATPAPLFPDVVTVRRHASPARIDQLTGDRGSCAVKDSFADTELAELGFTELFAARWIGRGIAPPDTAGTDWSHVTTPEGLQYWCASIGLPRALPARLLQCEHVRVMAKYTAERLVAGAITTVSHGVVGVSNVFGLTHTEQFWADLTAAVSHFYPSAPIVGYESDLDLAAALLAGFTDLGPLRIWTRNHWSEQPERPRHPR